MTHQLNPITPKLRPQNYASTSSKLQLLAALTSNTARCNNNLKAEVTNNMGKPTSQQMANALRNTYEASCHVTDT